MPFGENSMSWRRRATAVRNERNLVSTRRLERGRGYYELSQERRQPDCRQNGHTLVEMIVVVTILAVIAAVAAPSSRPAEHHQLSLATSVVADAMRFAREESRHTGVFHGVSTDLSANTVRVFRVEVSGDDSLMFFDIVQPISKQLYTIKIGAPPYNLVSLNSISGPSAADCDSVGSFVFDSNGVVRCVEPLENRISGASIELALGELRQTISIDEYTGRVSIQ